MIDYRGRALAEWGNIRGLLVDIEMGHDMASLIRWH